MKGVFSVVAARAPIPTTRTFPRPSTTVGSANTTVGVDLFDVAISPASITSPRGRSRRAWSRS